MYVILQTKHSISCGCTNSIHPSETRSNRALIILSIYIYIYIYLYIFKMIRPLAICSQSIRARKGKNSLPFKI